ncbi:DUF4157 domain-containing protein [Cognataquiflexum rubidum]|uniref:eCIS core domain-containing protein n=1 Tax=Cognataquiflexum rubidum TaxID=2922273 RepID=UPI001F129497|nr:DUF4157 domain-containing protein [Cognataquiflexum rubidum]MCH6236264.1 DUF4157 domain-containing protein [Cognataquiflexum rubidum]
MEAVQENKKSHSKPKVLGKESFFSATPIQTKLKVNQPGDKYEVEADQVAEQVIQKISASESDTSSPSQKNEPFITPNPTSVHLKGNSDDENLSQTLMTKRTNAETPVVSSKTSSQLFTSKGGGNPLPKNTQSEMEQAFVTDFSKVKIHTDTSAATLSKNLGAMAFTHGADIYFNSGKFDPDSQSGKKLLAHELTHFIQKSKEIQRDPDEDARKKEQEAIAKLKSEIKTAFSLKSVEDETSTWTLEELRITKEAIANIPNEDIHALKDVVLKRVSSLGGKTAGQFSSQQSVNDTTVTDEYELSLADLNFKPGTPEVEQKRLVQHEVGHAIATFPSRQANLASNKALAEYNTKINKENESSITFTMANDEMNLAVDELTKKVEEFNKESEPTIKKQLKGEMDALRKIADQKRTERTKNEKLLKADEAATKTAKTASDKKESEAKKHGISQTDLDAIDQSTSTAKSNHDKVLSKAIGGVTNDMKNLGEAVQYLTSVQALSTEIENFHSQTKSREKSEAEVESYIVGVDKKMEERIQAFESLSNTDAKHAILMTLAPVEQEQEKFFHAAKANALAHERSARVQKFVAFVELKNIPPISDYAQENWPHKPEEFYAEAYSFWTSGKLKAVSPDLQKWFDEKKYK